MIHHVKFSSFCSSEILIKVTFVISISVRQTSDVCVPIFCFDKNVFGDSARTPFGTLKWGSKRAKFLLESVQDVRRQLESKGSGLVITHGEPEEVFESFMTKMKQSNCDWKIVCQEEVLQEERAVAKSVQSALKRIRPSAKLEQIWGSTMYELKDLPFEENLSDMPDVYTPFRNKVEKKSFIQKPLPPPKTMSLPASDSIEYQAIAEHLSYCPTLKDLGYTEEQIELASSLDPRGVMEFNGGETAGLARVKDYIWEKDLLKVYFDTRNGMLGADYSTKFSPWLAHGCISPRYVAAECKRYEEERVANKSTYWVVFELLWRDYCKFFCLKHGDSVFFPGGTIGNHNKRWSTFENNFQAWVDGKTGYPLVDANMRELKATGFMSNRGRQNVASFLAIDLNHDWRLGGDWFESHLLDYDVYSNWYNWCAAAGMTGGRLNRFNITKQSKDYDAQGDYVRTWLPELKDVPTSFVHEPWKMTQFDQMQYKCRLGVDYPNPIVPPPRPGNGENRGGGDGKKARKPARNNRHQKYEMKSLPNGGYSIK